MALAGSQVLLDDQRTRLAEARLDSDLTHLVLHVPHGQHPVALRPGPADKV